MNGTRQLAKQTKWMIWGYPYFWKHSNPFKENLGIFVANQAESPSPGSVMAGQPTPLTPRTPPRNKGLIRPY